MLRSRINGLEEDKFKSTEVLEVKVRAFQEKLNLAQDQIQTLEEKINQTGQELLEKSQILFDKENAIVKQKEGLELAKTEKNNCEESYAKELNLISSKMEELKGELGSLKNDIYDLESCRVRGNLDIENILSNIEELNQEKIKLIKSNEEMVKLNSSLSLKSKMLTKDVEEVRVDNKDEYKIANSELSAYEDR